MEEVQGFGLEREWKWGILADGSDPRSKVATVSILRVFGLLEL
jgi:hypothetical protein